MKGICFIFVVFLACAYGQMCLEGSLPAARNLTFCSEFASSSCCSEMSDMSLELSYNFTIVPVFGDEGCGKNLKALLCAVTCSPNQALFASLSVDFQANMANETVYVNATFASGFFDSCKDRCLSPPLTIGQYAQNPYGFLIMLGTDSNPNYQPNMTMPRIEYMIGENPASNMSLYMDPLPAGSGDLQGCVNPPTPPPNSCVNPVAPIPIPRNLTFCTMYSSLGCCDLSSELELSNSFETKVKAVYGNTSCAENIKQMLCGWACGPTQGSVSTFTFNGFVNPGNQSIYVDPILVNGLFDSCKGRCLNPANLTFEQLFSGAPYPAAGFLLSFNSDLDPTYVPDLTHPRIFYNVGLNPSTNFSLNVSFSEPSPQDQEGCKGLPPSQTCLSPFSPFPLARNLTFCSMYASAGCCELSQELELSTNFNNKIVPILGNNGCAENLKELFCAWACGPQQALVATFVPGVDVNNQTIFVAPEFVNGLYASCKNRCFIPTGKTVDEIYGASANPGAGLLFNFNSDNDPSYVEDLVYHPRIIYSVGINVNTGFSVNSTVNPASGNDLTGCQTATTGSTNSVTTGGKNSLAVSIYANVALIVVALAATLISF